MRPQNTPPFLAGLFLLAASLPIFADTDPPNSAVPACQVAVPQECALPGQSSSSGPQQPRTILNLSATSEESCIESARQATAACQRSLGAKAEITALFRSGPVQTLHSIIGTGPSATAAVASRFARPRLPIVYGKNFETETEQYQYSPRFAPGPVNVRPDGLLTVRSGNFLQSQSKDGSWIFSDFATQVESAVRKLPDVAGFNWVWDNTSGYSDQRVFFDGTGREYTLAQGGTTRTKQGNSIGHRPYLAYRKGNMSSWEAAAIPAPDDRPSWRARIEYNDGNNDKSGPPAILLFDSDEGSSRSANLYLIVPKLTEGLLTIGTPILISQKSLLQQNHSGAANSVVSTADRIYVVYPSNQSTPEKHGTPAYMAIYNKKTATLEGETMIGAAGEASGVDNHDIPGICVGKGHSLHVLLPGHQEALKFLTGIPDGSKVKWSAVQTIGENPTAAGGYTYGSLNCDESGNVYITSRWAGDGYRFELVFLKRTADNSWAHWSGKAHQIIVDPGRAFYGAWRQSVATDNSGSIYLSYFYYANQLTPDELSKLKWRFPFHNWAAVKQVQPPMCVKGPPPRCWMHPMPEVTSVTLHSTNNGSDWDFVR